MIKIAQIKNPFPGLSPFEPGQADRFFGRSEQIRELTDRLQQHRFVAVVGTSGSGKSSLVRAGLIPNLMRGNAAAAASRWRITVLRPGRSPTVELAVSLQREFPNSEPEAVLEILQESSAGLARFARQHLRGGERLLLLVDQFEELFRYRAETDPADGGDECAAFVKLLLAASGHSNLPLPGLDELPIYVVITMRSDFLGDCSRFRGLPEALNESQYLVPRLTREQQREVIEGPIHLAGAAIEPALVQRLLNDVGDNPDQLPVLQHALMRTWEESSDARARGEEIGARHYEVVGRMDEALSRDADSVFATLGDEAKETIARRLFQRLVEVGAGDEETRHPTPVSEIVAVTDAPESEVREVIEVFRTRGFLTASADYDPIIDITHESLIRNWKRLKEWVHYESQSAALYGRLAETAELYSRSEAALLVDPQLQLTLNWLEKTKPNEAWARRYNPAFAEAMNFLEKSRQALTAEQRRSALKRARLTALILGVLLLLAIGASVSAVVGWRSARAERDRSNDLLDKSNRMLYDANIYLCQSAAFEGRDVQARSLLDELLGHGLKQLRGFEWFYLWRVVHAEEATLVGHSDGVLSVAFSPNGKMLASASADHTVKLWDPASGKEIVTFSGHSDAVSSVAFSPDGKMLASASGDHTLKLWDTASGKEIATFSGHSDGVSSVAFSPNDKMLASAGWDQTVRLWDIASRKEIATLSGHEDTVNSVAFSPDGKTLASGSQDETVRLWDVASRKELALISGHSRVVFSVAFSPDGRSLASASFDGSVKLWDLATVKELATLGVRSPLLLQVAFSPDGRTLAATSGDWIMTWDTASYKDLTTFSGHTANLKSVAFSPDSRMLASASTDHTVKMWDTALRNDLAVLSGHSSGVYSVAFSPDSKRLASASFDQTVKLWEISSRNELATLSGHSRGVYSVAFSSDNKTLASASADMTVKLWDSVSGKFLATLSNHSGAVYSVAFSPDGKTLASASGDFTVKLWDTASRKELATLSGHSGAAVSVTFSPDGKTLASASDDFTVKLWDIASRTVLATLSAHSNGVKSVAFSPDGKTLASTSYDQTVKLWDTLSHKQLATTLIGISSPVESIAFSPDGKTLASTSWDRTVRLWDTVSHKEMASLPGYWRSVYTVAFSPDGKTLASGSDQSVTLWFAATDEEVAGRR